MITNNLPREQMNIIVGISGASGVIYGIRLLDILNSIKEVDTHLVITSAGAKTIKIETDYSINQVEKLANHVYAINDIGASISSGSFKTQGMVVAPCSMKSLSAIAHSRNDNLLTRAADVTLKERRRLIMIPRETPLHLGHLKRMAEATEIGAILLPPMPAFYNKPQTIDDIINQTVQRCLDLLEIPIKKDIVQRWS